ncbi:MAG: metallophosphoesterase, partial [Luteibaculum sp.]
MKSFFTCLLVLVCLINLQAQDLLSRAPYLQKLAADQVTVRWRSFSPGTGVVRYGTSPENLDQSVEGEAPIATDHEVVLHDLQPNTKYYYQVLVGGTEIGNKELQYFTTAPAPGSNKELHFWVIGDAGTGNATQQAVLQSYLDFQDRNEPELTLMLGDNAYVTGLDAEYQTNLYDIYSGFYSHCAFYPTFGNHDSYSTNPLTQTGAYYSNFNLPADGELGGVPSGTEAYYSFNYGNVHFVSLDGNMVQTLLHGSAMADWLREDLSQNKQKWTVAMWHHPPYTKGSHDSDAEDELIYMREVINPILEEYGVDLGLGGHSHNYERSFLINGHYGFADSFDPEQHIVFPGDGRINGDGEYLKTDRKGTIYAVAGTSGGQLGGGPMDHPAMVLSTDSAGSFLLDVSDNELRGRFLTVSGNIIDDSVIRKEQNTS